MKGQAGKGRSSGQGGQGLRGEDGEGEAEGVRGQGRRGCGVRGQRGVGPMASSSGGGCSETSPSAVPCCLEAILLFLTMPPAPLHAATFTCRHRPRSSGGIWQGEMRWGWVVALCKQSRHSCLAGATPRPKYPKPSTNTCYMCYGTVTLLCVLPGRSTSIFSYSV